MPRWFWFVWITAGLVMEAWALWTKEAGDTLTEVTVATFPAWLVLGFLAWALAHFKERYDGRR